jgi:hypothetical protein
VAAEEIRLTKPGKSGRNIRGRGDGCGVRVANGRYPGLRRASSYRKMPSEPLHSPILSVSMPFPPDFEDFTGGLCEANCRRDMRLESLPGNTRVPGPRRLWIKCLGTVNKGKIRARDSSYPSGLHRLFVRLLLGPHSPAS